ncbi:hypothetical protein ABEF95_008901 [Exophiala dermatitidis]
MKDRPLNAGGKHCRPSSNMESLISCFHANSPHPQQQLSSRSPSYCYIPGQYWQTLDYYDMSTDIFSSAIENSGVPATSTFNHVGSFNDTNSTMTLDSPLGSMLLEENSSPEDWKASENPTEPFAEGGAPVQLESSGHARDHHHHHPCEVCERDKRERRKEQNRKAQRNHRLRGEAKLEQLRAKIQSQTEEIALLKEANQELQKSISTLKCGRGRSGGSVNMN